MTASGGRCRFAFVKGSSDGGRCILEGGVCIYFIYVETKKRPTVFVTKTGWPFKWVYRHCSWLIMLLVPILTQLNHF